MTRLPFEVFVFVRRGDEFLVAHRVPSGGSYWHGIAGGVEEGEDAATVHPFIVDVPAGREPELNNEHDEYRLCSREDGVELLYRPEPKELLRTIA